MFLYNKQVEDNKVIYYADTVFENNKFKNLNKKIIALNVGFRNSYFEGVAFFNESYFKTTEMIEILIAVDGIRWYVRHIKRENLTMEFLLRAFNSLNIDSLLPELITKEILSQQDGDTIKLVKEMT